MKVSRGVVALSVALAVVAAPGSVAHAETAKPPKKVGTIVSLTFDDGDSSHPAAARMLEKRACVERFTSTPNPRRGAQADPAPARRDRGQGGTRSAATR